MAECADNLEAASSLVNAQLELEADIHRAAVDRAIESIIEVCAAQGMFAFRLDPTSDLPVISQPWNAGETAYVQ